MQLKVSPVKVKKVQVIKEQIMAYFDSAKNKAIWQKRLAVLEAERDRRKREGYKPEPKRGRTGEKKKTMAAGVRIISYEQLVEKEKARTRARKEQARERQRELARQRQRDQKAL